MKKLINTKPRATMLIVLGDDGNMLMVAGLLNKLLVPLGEGAASTQL